MLSKLATREYKQYTPRELRLKLAEHGISGTEFAQMVGISQPSMSGILTGRQNPSKITRIRIADVIEELDAAQPAEEEEQLEPVVTAAPRARRL